ncbi:6487_t:CDS:2, partial [Rhizophagus irregularis]
CGKAFATSQKLCRHQNRKFLCKPTAKPQDPTPEIIQLQPQSEQLQDPTPEIVQLQPQPEQLQELTPEVIPAHAEKTPNLTIDKLAKWLAGPGDYRGRWCDIQFVKRSHDSARSHKSLKHKTVWQADLKPNVRDIPYFPSIIADTHQKITEILESELEEKGQIKSAITILATYTDNNGTYKQVYHRGVMRVLLLKNDIDDHLTKSAVDITDKIVKFMKGGSGWKIVSIDILTIETYTYRRAEGGSYILTPKALANKKCTINPDNKDLIDLDTGLPSEKCLQGALGAYFTYKDGHTQKLERIFQAEKFKPYLE